MPAILTLKQLNDMTSAFNEFDTVEESTLPDYYKDIFPRKCKCGGEVILTRKMPDQQGFTQLQCCNPDCWIKMAHRFAYFTKSLGFKGFGETTAVSLYSVLHVKFEYPTFLSIFEMPLSDIMAINGEAYALEFEAMKNSLSNDGFQFKDAIASLGIPDLGKGSRIFDVVKEPRVLLNYVVKKKTDELCEVSGIYASKSRFFLDLYRLDIVTLMRYVMPHILSTPKREVNVAITGHVTVDDAPLTRVEFIWKCESLTDANGAQMYKIIETKAESKLDYVIADAPSSSSKYRLGEKLGILLTAQQFYDNLKSSLEEGQQDGQ